MITQRPTRFAAWLLLGMVAALGRAERLEAQALESERCVECHRGLDEERLASPARTFSDDLHGQLGFGCLACHGTLAGREAASGFLSKPEGRQVPELCGRCHSDAEYMRRFNPSPRVDQVTEYRTSVHGQRLMREGDAAVANCTDCHRAHGMRRPNDPESSVYPLNVAEMCGRCHSDPAYMAGRNIPTDQLDEYRTSVHGRLMFEEGDASAPTCNDCHGNHGAAPPGIGSIRNVCGQCHATMADLFSQNGHPQLFEAAGLPGCETCHGNHSVQPTSDENLADRSADVCERCHRPGDQHGGEFRTIQTMLDSLKAAFAGAWSVLETAANAGMEVSQAEFELEEVNNALTRARGAVHSFRVEPVKAHIDEGLKLTTAGFARGEAAMDEHRFRRVGLALSSIIILVLIVGLLMKIRQIDRRQAASGSETPGEERHA